MDAPRGEEMVLEIDDPDDPDETAYCGGAQPELYDSPYEIDFSKCETYGSSASAAAAYCCNTGTKSCERFTPPVCDTHSPCDCNSCVEQCAPEQCNAAASNAVWCCDDQAEACFLHQDGATCPAGITISANTEAGCNTACKP